ncbi:hypothetical protein CSA37_00280 [Candidatus Fermentibacteria bacterium]|nr:MAG: hypothetical protein CSA37_00280 [Candidatus Fermentibacteria bacterium]
MKYDLSVAVIISMMILISCQESADRSQDAPRPFEASHYDQEYWISYFESSDNGLWENDTLKHITYKREGHLSTSSGEEVSVFRPYSMCVYDGNIYITDAGVYQIVALDEGYSELWRAGDQGEGPGHFTMMTSLAATKDFVLALNSGLSRVEVFDRETGDYSHSFQFMGAEDIITIDDSTVAIGSRMNSDGDIHIVDVHGDILQSFGVTETLEYHNIPRSDLMRLAYDSNGRICIFNRYEGRLAIYDIDSEECIYRGSRSYPSEPRGPLSLISENGEERQVYFPIGGNVFLGYENTINVVLCNVMQDRSFISDPEYLDYAPVTLIDRYNWEGSYLDTYCLPDSCISHVTMLSEDMMIGRNYAEGAIKVFSVE